MSNIKPIIGAILLIVVISSCTQSNVKTSKTKIVVKSGDTPLEIVIIENCEYLKTPNCYGYFNLTHKGNCKNFIHLENLRR